MDARCARATSRARVTAVVGDDLRSSASNSAAPTRAHRSRCTAISLRSSGSARRRGMVQLVDRLLTVTPLPVSTHMSLLVRWTSPSLPVPPRAPARRACDQPCAASEFANAFAGSSSRWMRLITCRWHVGDLGDLLVGILHVGEQHRCGTRRQRLDGRLHVLVGEDSSARPRTATHPPSPGAGAYSRVSTSLTSRSPGRFAAGRCDVGVGEDPVEQPSGSSLGEPRRRDRP